MQTKSICIQYIQYWNLSLFCCNNCLYKQTISHIITRNIRLVLIILHCPYTQISPSLHLILSLLSLDNFLIDFQAFMDWRFLLFSCHCSLLCYWLSFSFPCVLNCCICFNAGSWHTQTRARAAWSLKFARGGSPFGRPPHTAQNAAGRQAKQRKNE